jgi:hypothetical protein
MISSRTNEETAANEHADGLGRRLDSDTDEHDYEC